MKTLIISNQDFHGLIIKPSDNQTVSRIDTSENKPERLDSDNQINISRLISFLVMEDLLGNAIDSGMGLSITIDKLRVFINKTLSILSSYQ
jgi:hypothetical protein